MKKPALAALGVVGACAACCAIPVALPLISGLSALGIVGLGADALGAQREVLIGAAALSFAGVAGAVVWWKRRNSAAACAAPAATSGAQASGCGCSSTAGAQGACR